MSIKLVIWDLDDTLWAGTLADDARVTLFVRRADMIRTLNARGVLSSICSKNDFQTARARLVALGLWDEFVFPHIAFTPKGPAVAAIIDDMQLRAQNVLFVDDNPANLREVAHAVPQIQLLDASAADCDDDLQALVDAHAGVERNRIAEYRMLERKKGDRTTAGVSNEDFLRGCGIKACAPYLMDNLDFAGRIAELINRSNQLNYTASRVTEDALERDIIDVVAFDSWSIFAWDNYGHYGLVGFVMVDRKIPALVHFAFSCRVMHMGMEAYALDRVREKFPAIDTSALDGRFSRTAPDWIADQSFHDPAVRGALIASHVTDVAQAASLRIMFDCQSGGIAHFSAHRAVVEFDNNPRLFALKSLRDGSVAAQQFPPHVVYGAGIDYSDPRWGDDAQFLEAGLYAWCVTAMCRTLGERGVTALIVLPPDNAAPGQYRAHMNHTRERTQRFNAIWRDAAGAWPHVSLLDLSDLAHAGEMIDVSHYTAGLLQKIAWQVDGWYEQETGMREAMRRAG
ncbi:HAD-IIIC family phosphatase [Sphingomonas sp. RT2P30]|uniref:HAD-IIIC family phosphatase n=1 Tax=Parasphingomonas halimpatiens TaxID=3096162 RepID=UPI002FCA053F